MPDSERRTHAQERQAKLKAELNDAQHDTLRELEQFGWELKVVRHPLFQPPVPVVFDSTRERFAVLRDDGSLDENPGFDIRH